MIRKFQFSKIHCPKFKLIEQQFQYPNSDFQQPLLKTIKTPLHQNQQSDQLDIMKTQKLFNPKNSQNTLRPLSSKLRLQPLVQDKINKHHLECQQKIPTTCQTDRVAEKRDFVIRKQRNISFSCLNKQKNDSKSDQSLEKDYNPSKIGTDTESKKGGQQRVKAHSKHERPACKIVHSKKLPFHLLGQSVNPKKQSLPLPDWNVSIIFKKGVQELVSLESYKELTNLL